MPVRRDSHLMGEPLAMPDSLWAATAIPAPATHSLKGTVAADVAILGAGFTGLAAALALAENGRSVVVVDAAEPGWGASGRNNGQIIPGLKLDPDEVVARCGERIGERLVQWSGEAPARTFALIERHKIPCNPVRAGWIQPAYTERDIAIITHRHGQWRRRGVNAVMLDRGQLPAMLGTPAFFGAWLDPRGGTIHPLNYARGLARVAMDGGAQLFARAKVDRLQRVGEAWRLETADGRVEARQVIVATNAYTEDLVPGLRRSIVPLRTAQVATRPLPDSIRKTILPGRQGASDTRRLLTSFRLSTDGRLMMGGSGATGGAHTPALLHHLHRSAKELFAHLGPLEWEYGWSGYLALTPDHLPHIHEPARGMVVALGCNGRGIAISTAMGGLLAERLLGRAAGEMALPVTPIRTVPFHGLRHPVLAAATAVKRVQDAIDRRRGGPRDETSAFGATRPR